MEVPSLEAGVKARAVFFTWVCAASICVRFPTLPILERADHPRSWIVHARAVKSAGELYAAHPFRIWWKARLDRSNSPKLDHCTWKPFPFGLELTKRHRSRAQWADGSGLLTGV